jgi:RND superfamily putative drug exporter
VLLLLGAQVTRMRVGEPSAAALATGGPATDGLRAYERAGFPLGALSPIEVLVPRGSAPGPLAARLAALPGVAAVVAPSGPAWRRGGSALVEVLPRDEVSAAAGTQTLARVRQQVARSGGGVQVGGAGATLVDETAAFYDRAPLILAAIAAITVVLLTRAFRSPLLAIKAIVLNVLSIGATYGVVVLVWQEGHGSELLWGIPATGSITNWGPLMTFAFLFGLSMDYEVFILTRIREEHDRTGSTTEAIVEGVGRTGRLVTSAALILCLAFAALSASPETDLKVVATGLGAGILLDATLVRALLVPALIALFGRWNWWVPAWLARALRMPVALPASSAPVGRLTVG